ncbi:hypothetical protein DFH28DRAFT_92642 [Melampsora americana]|nr:hypothetical protein DFH28DRAFT_92642 [Melampsora americana]
MKSENEPILFGMSHRQQKSQDHYLRPPLPPTSTSRSKSDLIDFSQHQYGHQSSKAQEQLSQLNVAVGIGDLSRARTIILEVEKSLGYIRKHPFDSPVRYADNQAQVSRSKEAKTQNLPTLNEVVNTSLFSGLLRNLLNEAIKQEKLGNRERQKKHEDEVFHWLLNFRYNGPEWAQVDHHLLAGVLKGVLCLQQPSHTALDYMPWILPHTSSNEYVPTSSFSQAPTLLNILNSITFSTSHTKSFFGPLEKQEALTLIKKEAMSANRDDVLAELANVEAIWKDSRQNQDEMQSTFKVSSITQPSELSPVRKLFRANMIARWCWSILATILLKQSGLKD